MGAEPVCAAYGGSIIETRLERGRGYLVLGTGHDASAFLASLPRGHPAYLRVTAEPRAEADETGTVLRATAASGSMGTFDPKRLADVRAAADSFLDEHPGGIVVLDCLDLLIRHNGVERAVRAIEDLHDEVVTRDAVLAVFLDTRGSPPRLVAWLQRELDLLRPRVQPVPVAHSLPV